MSQHVRERYSYVLDRFDSWGRVTFSRSSERSRKWRVLGGGGTGLAYHNHVYFLLCNKLAYVLDFRTDG